MCTTPQLSTLLEFLPAAPISSVNLGVFLAPRCLLPCSVLGLPLFWLRILNYIPAVVELPNFNEKNHKHPFLF